METFLSPSLSLSLLLPQISSLNVGLRDGDYFLDFPHHHDACEHLLQLLARDWLGRVPYRAVRGYNRLWRQVICVIPAFGSLRAEKKRRVLCALRQVNEMRISTEIYTKGAFALIPNN